MKITINLLENQKLEAQFANYTLLSDQPLDNKGEASAPSPFDYFLASTALCAGYFVKAYCQSRNISMEGIKIIQENSKDDENKYKQKIVIKVEVPECFSLKDRESILRSVEGCSVKKQFSRCLILRLKFFPRYLIELLG